MLDPFLWPSIGLAEDGHACFVNGKQRLIGKIGSGGRRPLLDHKQHRAKEKQYENTHKPYQKQLRPYPRT